MIPLLCGRSFHFLFFSIRQLNKWPHILQNKSPREVIQCSKLSLWTYNAINCQSTPFQLANLHLVAKWETNNYELELIPQRHYRTWKNRMKRRKEPGGLNKSKTVTSQEFGFKKNIYLKKIFEEGKKKSNLSFGLKGRKKICPIDFPFLSQARWSLRHNKWKEKTLSIDSTKKKLSAEQSLKSLQNLPLFNVSRSWHHYFSCKCNLQTWISIRLQRVCFVIYINGNWGH